MDFTITILDPCVSKYLEATFETIGPYSVAFGDNFFITITFIDDQGFCGQRDVIVARADDDSNSAVQGVTVQDLVDQTEKNIRFDTI